MEDFLRSVERRAFRMARYHVANEEDALDIVQDAMLKLVERYADRPCEEWRPLFWRILRNRVKDAHRRSSVLGRLKAMAGFLAPSGAGESREIVGDPMDRFPGDPSDDPSRRAELSDASARLDQALQNLPARQREAFLLRAWEGLSVRETALAMGCTQGSVKTHHSRAISALREQLGEHWP